MRIPPLRRTLLTGAILFSGVDLLSFYLPIYGHSIGLSATTIGLILGAYAAAAFVVRLVMPAMVKKAGEEKILTLSLLVSGATAGLAGALEVAGPIGQLTPYVPAGYGFAAIIVAFVGRLHPAGMVLSAILMSMFYIGGELAQSRLGLPKSITGVFQGLLLFCLLACDTLVAYRLRLRKA